MNRLLPVLVTDVSITVRDPDHKDKYLEAVALTMTTKRRLQLNSRRAYRYHTRLTIKTKPYGYQPFEETVKYVSRKPLPLDTLDALSEALAETYYKRRHAEFLPRALQSCPRRREAPRDPAEWPPPGVPA